MDIYRVIEMSADIGTILQLVTNFVIAGLLLKAFQRIKLPGSLLVFSACCLTIGAIIFEMVTSNILFKEDTQNHVWLFNNVVWLTDIVLFAVGMIRIIKFTLKDRLT